jgi:hypothetical protein
VCAERANRLAAVLLGRYGLAVGPLEPAARGWTGETYVATAGGARYFVKVYPRDRLPPTALPALPALAELRRLGLPEVSPPVPATDGTPHAAASRKTFPQPSTSRPPRRVRHGMANTSPAA